MDYTSLRNALISRVIATHKTVGDRWPYHADPMTGAWETTEAGDWCAGHWIEMLRIAHEVTGDIQLLDSALRRLEFVKSWLVQDDMFRGPIYYYGAARMGEYLNRDDYRELALIAAGLMRGMAIPANGGMPIGTQVRVAGGKLKSSYIVAVDNVHPNLVLDWYALHRTGNLRYEDGARRHLDLTEREFIRPDGSTVEFIAFDRFTGHASRKFTGLGHADDSCWSRGQAWAIAGYLRAFEELGDERYAAIARRLWEYWVLRCDPGSLIPPWDFDDPAEDRPLDTSAAAIVAEQFARLHIRPDRRDTVSDMLQSLDPLLAELSQQVTTGADGRPPGMLLNGCFRHPANFAIRHELLWGDFYLLSAVHALISGGLPC